MRWRRTSRQKGFWEHRICDLARDENEAASATLKSAEAALSKQVDRSMYKVEESFTNTLRLNMARQGKTFTIEELNRILSLLSNTEMAIAEIAERMNCSRSAIGSINRKYRIREYAGLRSSWILPQAERRPA
jgi:hypothetical protein